MACFVLLLYPCTLSNLTTGTDLRMNVFFLFRHFHFVAVKPWALWNESVEHL